MVTRDSKDGNNSVGKKKKKKKEKTAVLLLTLFPAVFSDCKMKIQYRTIKCGIVGRTGKLLAIRNLK